jgi:hydrogenase expression/formation protein HypC
VCLAIPGKISALHENMGVPMAKVDFGGITRDACLSYVPDARIGDYVLVHVGFAISKVDEEEAARTYKFLAEMDQLTELDDGEPELTTSQEKPGGGG